MRQALWLIIAGLALGFAAAAWLPQRPSRALTPAMPPLDAVPAATTSAPRPVAPITTEPVAAASDIETEAAAVDAETATDALALEALAAGVADVRDAPRPDVASAVAARRARTIEQLVAAGFSRARAETITALDAELRAAAAYERFSSRGSVRPLDPARATDAASRLRAELGDDDYTRFLEATGQPSRAVVGTLEPDSAAALAGLQAGDEILSYAGQRVFSLRELDALARAGVPGEAVPARVIRDGDVLELYVTRGPLGVRLGDDVK